MQKSKKKNFFRIIQLVVNFRGHHEYTQILTETGTQRNKEFSKIIRVTKKILLRRKFFELHTTSQKSHVSNIYFLVVQTKNIRRQSKQNTDVEENITS